MFLTLFPFYAILLLVVNLLKGPMSFLPFAVPIATAALIAGLSPATFKAIYIETGAVRMVGNRVVLDSLAEHMGEPITAERYLLADRQRDAARSYQSDYRKNH